MSADEQWLMPKQCRRAAAVLRNGARAVLLLPLILLGCSGVALPEETAPVSGSDPAFHKVIADYLKDTLKDVTSYDAFEISDARWVHTVKGWSWLACVRFQDRQHQRSYAAFIKENKVIDGRYAIGTDSCDTQTYSPFDLMPDKPKPAGGSELEPLH
jgi:hypothetical protein